MHGIYRIHHNKHPQALKKSEKGGGALIRNQPQPGVVAHSEACSLGMQAAPNSIPTSCTFFVETWSWKKISMAILPLLLIQEEQLSVTGERKCTKYW